MVDRLLSVLPIRSAPLATGVPVLLTLEEHLQHLESQSEEFLDKVSVMNPT